MTTALTESQSPPAPEKPFDFKRCTPRVVKQGGLLKNMGLFVQKGDQLRAELLGPMTVCCSAGIHAKLVRV